jgi:hypothetical protein
MLARTILLMAGLMAPATVMAQTGDAPLVLERKIPLGEVSGRIDHLGVDVQRQRLFVAELGNDSLGVVDLASGTARTTRLPGPRPAIYQLGDGMKVRLVGPAGASAK